MRRNWRWIFGLGALFIGRLLFGLTSEFFSEDETQIYLMGLRYYATGEWPYFGPDVVWTGSEIPGALQPLLVGLPLRAAPFPESPFILLNVLSCTALAALAWYIGRRLPSLPRWLIWGWVFTAPWMLQFSTHVNNPSYVLPAAVVFFVGLFEAIPSLSIGVLSRQAAFFMMGAAVTWTLQIHMSWPLLVPFAAVAFVSGNGAETSYRRGRTKTEQRSNGDLRCFVSPFLSVPSVHSVIWFLAGAALPATLLVPTYLRYGLHAGSGASNVHLHFVRPDRILTTLAQVFSFASLEINRFIAIDDAKRWMFFQDHAWLVPAALIVFVAGILQPVWMLVSWFRSAPTVPGWLAIRRLVAFTVALIYLSYWFVVEQPQAHAFYAMAPPAFIFAACCWQIVDSRRWRRVAAVTLAVNIVFHAALAWTQAPEQSMYRNRRVVAAAIRARQPDIFGHRRPFAVNAGPDALRDPSRPYDIKDLSVSDRTLRVGWGRSTIWNISVTNANPRVAFRNLIYIASYYDGEGTLLQRHEDVLKDVVQPGETKTFRLADTIVRARFQDARLEVVAAEALLPIVPRGPSTPDTDRVRTRARAGSFPP